jgi:multicomponent Na+:H+ antiporter subunit D
MSGYWLLLPVLLPSVCGGVVLFAHNRRLLHPALVILLVSELLLVLALGSSCTTPAILFHATDTLTFALQTDSVSLLFGLVVTVAWLLAAVFAMRYLDHEEHPLRFFAFFLFTLSALLLICFSANLPTLYMGYEAMTLLSLPLVLHSGTKAARNAGIKYLGFSVLGAAMGLLGMILLQQAIPGLAFAPGGADAALGENVAWIWLLLCMGFGCKAGLYPLHGWLPTAHPVAPAPASAVLSGVITKMGVLAIVRVTFFLMPQEALAGSWAQLILLLLSLGTIFLGSMLAYREPLLKKRLAWSTVSQVSYILFGIFLLSAGGLNGALLQLLFHAIAKNGLFLAVGAVIFATGRTRVDQMQGAGLQLPWTMAAFTLCALSLIGIPPLGGFFSKWELLLAALETTTWPAVGFAGVIILLISAILTAGYLLPIIRDAYFPGADFPSPARLHPGKRLTLPPLAFGLLTLLGLMPAATDALVRPILQVLFA